MSPMVLAFMSTGVVFVVVCGFLFLSVYNALIEVRNQVDQTWANIEAVLKQRFDEIPQLVQVTEQFANFEKGVIDRLVKARARYGSATRRDQKVKAANEMNLALQGLFAIGENYPELKSSEQFLHLQSRITRLEDTLTDRREAFNNAVTIYNTRIAQIPEVFFAGLLQCRPMEQFKVESSERAKPSVQMKLAG